MRKNIVWRGMKLVYDDNLEYWTGDNQYLWTNVAMCRGTWTANLDWRAGLKVSSVGEGQTGVDALEEALLKMTTSIKHTGLAMLEFLTPTPSSASSEKAPLVKRKVKR